MTDQLLNEAMARAMGRDDVPDFCNTPKSGVQACDYLLTHPAAVLDRYEDEAAKLSPGGRYVGSVGMSQRNVIAAILRALGQYPEPPAESEGSTEWQTTN